MLSYVQHFEWWQSDHVMLSYRQGEIGEIAVRRLGYFSVLWISVDTYITKVLVVDWLVSI